MENKIKTTYTLELIEVDYGQFGYELRKCFYLSNLSKSELNKIVNIIKDKVDIEFSKIQKMNGLNCLFDKTIKEYLEEGK